MDVLRERLYYINEWKTDLGYETGTDNSKAILNYPENVKPIFKPVAYQETSCKEYFSVIVNERHQTDNYLLPIGSRTTIVERCKNGDYCLCFRGINKFLDIELVGINFLKEIVDYSSRSATSGHNEKRGGCMNVETVIIQRKLGGFIFSVCSENGEDLIFISKHIPKTVSSKAIQNRIEKVAEEFIKKQSFEVTHALICSNDETDYDHLDAAVTGLCASIFHSIFTTVSELGQTHWDKPQFTKVKNETIACVKEMTKYLVQNDLYISGEVIDPLHDTFHPLLEKLHGGKGINTLNMDSILPDKHKGHGSELEKLQTKETLNFFPDCLPYCFIFSLGIKDSLIEKNLDWLSVAKTCLRFKLNIIPSVVFVQDYKFSEMQSSSELWENMEHEMFFHFSPLSDLSITLGKISEVISDWSSGNHEGYVILIEEIARPCLKRWRGEIEKGEISHLDRKYNTLIHPLRVKVKTVKYKCYRILRELLTKENTKKKKKLDFAVESDQLLSREKLLFLQLPCIIQLFFLFLVKMGKGCSKENWREEFDTFCTWLNVNSSSIKFRDVVLASSLQLSIPKLIIGGHIPTKKESLILMCGLPASGKSTFAKLLVQNLQSHGIFSLHISRDEIFDALVRTNEISDGFTLLSSNRYNRSVQKKVHHYYSHQIKSGRNMLSAYSFLSHCKAFPTSLSGLFCSAVIIDSCNCTVGTRAQWRRLFPPSNGGMISILAFLNTSIQDCIKSGLTRMAHESFPCRTGQPGDDAEIMRSIIKVAKVFKSPRVTELYESYNNNYIDDQQESITRDSTVNSPISKIVQKMLHCCQPTRDLYDFLITINRSMNEKRTVNGSIYTMGSNDAALETIVKLLNYSNAAGDPSSSGNNLRDCLYSDLYKQWLIILGSIVDIKADVIEPIFLQASKECCGNYKETDEAYVYVVRVLSENTLAANVFHNLLENNRITPAYSYVENNIPLLLQLIVFSELYRQLHGDEVVQNAALIQGTIPWLNVFFCTEKRMQRNKDLHRYYSRFFEASNLRNGTEPVYLSNKIQLQHAALLHCTLSHMTHPKCDSPGKESINWDLKAICSLRITEIMANPEVIVLIVDTAFDVTGNALVSHVAEKNVHEGEPQLPLHITIALRRSCQRSVFSAASKLLWSRDGDKNNFVRLKFKNQFFVQGEILKHALR